MMRVVQAGIPQPRNTGTTVTTGGTQAATLVRSQDGGLPNRTLGTWVATRPDLTLRPALPLPCRRRVSPGTPALLIIHSRPGLRQHTTMPLRAKRAPGRPTLGLLHCSQRQTPRLSHRCKVGRRLQDRSSRSHHHPGRHPRAQHHVSHRHNSSNSSSSNSRVLGNKPPSRLHPRLGYSLRASQPPGAQPLLPANQRGNLSQAPPQPQGPSQQDRHVQSRPAALNHPQPKRPSRDGLLRRRQLQDLDLQGRSLEPGLEGPQGLPLVSQGQKERVYSLRSSLVGQQNKLES